jgi:hypothetical protein
MRKFIYGVIVGFILAIFFIVFGGGQYLEKFGVKTEKAGQDIVEYEEELKDKISRAKKKVGKKTKDIKEGAIDKKERVKKYVE